MDGNKPLITGRDGNDGASSPTVDLKNSVLLPGLLKRLLKAAKSLSLAWRPQFQLPILLGKTLALLSSFVLLGTLHAQTGGTIPATHATALDGHSVTLPQNLGAQATVLILGFGRHSADATTAWEKPVRAQLAQAPAITFYDMAMLAEVPGFIRPMVLHSIRNKVPPILQPNFLPLTAEEDAWKHIAGYQPDQPDAAYVLLVDHTGHVLWSSHAAFTNAAFAELNGRAHSLGQ